MNLVFACGGTAGHINPAIAVADAMRRRYPDCRILFIGASGHMEEKLVPKAGYDLRVLPGSGLSRRITVAGIKQNIYAAKCVLSAVRECKKIFREFRPDAVIGTGGYASFPALRAGAQMGIPVFVHESNAVPGVTTRMAARYAQEVMVCFEESRQYYPGNRKVTVVGMPVSSGFLTWDRDSARKQLGLSEEEGLVVSAFGSLGARDMNKMTADLFALEKSNDFPFRHIHAAGSFGWKWMPDLVKEKGVDLSACESIDMREYIYDMPLLMAAADVMISRAGASTCNELAAAGVPGILIPSPNVTNNHQEKNARLLEARGGVKVILESDCTADGVFAMLQDLLKDREGRKAMRKSLKEMAHPDAAEQICNILEKKMSR